MEYSYLGKSGMKVSRLCLGTMNFGPNTDEKEAFRIMDTALENGINFFDTADMYGNRNGGEAHPGWTEEIIGRWMKTGGGRREKVIIGTKVFFRMFDYMGINDEPGLSAYKIKRRLEASLKRMQTDHVELFSMHSCDKHAPWDEIWGAYEDLICEGKVYYAGSSNFSAENLAIAQAAAEKRGFMGIVTEQHRCSLLERTAQFNVFSQAKDLGIGLTIYSPLCSGLLSGTIFGEADSKKRTNKYEGLLEEDLINTLRDYSALCREIGASESAVAIAWLLSKPEVSTVLLGPRTAEHVLGSLPAADLKLDSELISRLEKMFPMADVFHNGVRRPRVPTPQVNPSARR